MSTSYDGVIIDHLAEHILYLSTASLFWFSLSSSHGHGFHLSQWLGMSPHDYKCLLVAANLAQFHPKWGFIVKIVQWEHFIEGHRFNTSNGMGTFEVDTKKLDLHAFINGTPKQKLVRMPLHLAFLQLILPEKSRCRKIVMAEWNLLPQDWSCRHGLKRCW